MLSRVEGLFWVWFTSDFGVLVFRWFELLGFVVQGFLGFRVLGVLGVGFQLVV